MGQWAPGVSFRNKESTAFTAVPWYLIEITALDKDALNSCRAIAVDAAAMRSEWSSRMARMLLGTDCARDQEPVFVFTFAA